MLDMNTTFGTYMKQIITDISPPLSYLKVLICSLDAFLISAFNSMKFSKTSNFFLMKKAHVYLEKSSIKVRTYQYPFKDVMGIGLLISE